VGRLLDSTTIEPLSWPDGRPVGDMLELIASTVPLAALQAGNTTLALDSVELLAPIPVPRRSIFCVGKNYRDHAREFAQSGFDSSARPDEHIPQHPVVFTKQPSTVIAAHAPIPRHARVTQQLDYEAEIGVVIGKAGSAICKARALEHVFGYTLINDVTARDMQKQHRQWFLGKSLDGFCPMGPYLVTADALDAADMPIRCWVNGELRQDSNVKHLIFDIPTLIETLSAGIMLQPGDIIATGTPAGVGAGFDPPRFLQAGDVVRVEAPGIGLLENQVA